MPETKQAGPAAAPAASSNSATHTPRSESDGVQFRVGDEPVVEVKFLRTVKFESGGRNKGPLFVKDRSYRFGEAFAQRWIKRNAAYDVRVGPPPPPEELERAPSARGGASGTGLDG